MVAGGRISKGGGDGGASGRAPLVSDRWDEEEGGYDNRGPQLDKYLGVTWSDRPPPQSGLSARQGVTRPLQQPLISGAFKGREETGSVQSWSWPAAHISQIDSCFCLTAPRTCADPHVKIIAIKVFGARALFIFNQYKQSGNDVEKLKYCPSNSKIARQGHVLGFLFSYFFLKEGFLILLVIIIL